MSAETPTAAEVLRAHAGCRWVVAGPGEGLMSCGAPFPASGRDEPAEHQADMLAAAGLLVTAELALALDQFRNAAHSVATSPAVVTFERWLAEHDAQVAARALREAAFAWRFEDPPCSGADDWGRGWLACRDAVVYDLGTTRADRIAGGGES